MYHLKIKSFDFYRNVPSTKLINLVILIYLIHTF